MRGLDLKKDKRHHAKVSKYFKELQRLNKGEVKVTVKEDSWRIQLGDIQTGILFVFPIDHYNQMGNNQELKMWWKAIKGIKSPEWGTDKAVYVN